MAFARSSDTDVWWEEAGEGEPVLLINGWGSPSTTWFRLVEHLSPRFRVVTFDNRGVGRTGVPPGPYPVSVMAGDALSVLDAADVTAAHVVGISMGGLIAQELALQAPERVRSLVLAATHRGIPHLHRSDPAVLETMLGAADLPPTTRYEALAAVLYAADTARAEIDRDNAARERYPTERDGYLHQIGGASTWDRSADLERIRIPTLVLHGTADLVIPPANGEALAAAIPTARLHVLDGAGHTIFTDRERDATAVLVGFFESAAHDREQHRTVNPSPDSRST